MRFEAKLIFWRRIPLRSNLVEETSTFGGNNHADNHTVSKETIDVETVNFQLLLTLTQFIQSQGLCYSNQGYGGSRDVTGCQYSANQCLHFGGIQLSDEDLLRKYLPQFFYTCSQIFRSCKGSLERVLADTDAERPKNPIAC